MLERANSRFNDFRSISNLLDDAQKALNAAMANDVNFILNIIAAQIRDGSTRYHNVLMIL